MKGKWHSAGLKTQVIYTAHRINISKAITRKNEYGHVCIKYFRNVRVRLNSTAFAQICNRKVVFRNIVLTHLLAIMGSKYMYVHCTYVCRYTHSRICEKMYATNSK